MDHPLIIISLVLIFGYLGGRVSKWLKMPAVVGYLIAGLIFGQSFFNILTEGILKNLAIFNEIALSVVAFVIGSQMHRDVLRKMGKSITVIIFSECFLTFFLVTLGVYFLKGDIATALIFGAMAPASAPAGTAVVLQEYKAKGPLTNALYAVVGLDDGLAIMIYAFAAAFAKFSLVGRADNLFQIIKGPLREIIVAIILGIAMGIFCGFFIRKLRERGEILSISLASVILCGGLAIYFHCSLIMANLILGIVSANFFVFANKRAVEALNSISLPIYTIFFVIAGAHLNIWLLPSMGLLGFIYIILRSLGLISGAYLGASLTRANEVIRKYLGFGILSQAGVAIGLAIMVTSEFSSLGGAGVNLSTLTINTVAATTIVFEIIGPIGTKFAISRAGEIGAKRR